MNPSPPRAPWAQRFASDAYTTSAVVGRGTAVISAITGTLIGLLLIIIGVVMIVSRNKEATDPTKDKDKGNNNGQTMSPTTSVLVGLGLIVFGLVICISGWVWVWVTGKSKTAAAIGGVRSLRRFI